MTERLPAPADTLDAMADGAFGGRHDAPVDARPTPLLGDSSDVDPKKLSHRQGYGLLEFAGRHYTRAAWVERCADEGHCLAAGEGQLLTRELKRLRALIRTLGGNPDVAE